MAVAEREQVVTLDAMAPAPSRRGRGALDTRVLVGRLGAVFISNGVYVAGAFLGNVVTANALTPADFGFFSLAVATMIIVQEMCGSGFDLAMVRFAAQQADNRDRVSMILDAALSLKFAVNMLAGLALFAAAGPVASRAFGEPRLIDPLRWAAVGVVGTALFQNALARFQAREEFSRFATAKSLNSLLKLALLGLLAVAGALTLRSALVVSVLTLFAGFGLALVQAPTSLSSVRGVRAHFGLWWEILSFGRWVIVTHLLFSLYARIDVVMLGHYGGELEVAYYTVAWNLSFLIDLCTYSVIIAMMPHTSRMQTLPELRAYGAQTLRTTGALALALVPAVFLSGPFVRMVFPGYEAAAPIFRVLFIGCLFTLIAHPLYLILYARDRVQLVAGTNLLLAIAAAAGCWVLVPRYGTTGAAMATVAARFLNAVAVLVLVFRELRGGDPALAADM